MSKQCPYHLCCIISSILALDIIRYKWRIMFLLLPVSFYQRPLKWFATCTMLLIHCPSCNSRSINVLCSIKNTCHAASMYNSDTSCSTWTPRLQDHKHQPEKQYFKNAQAYFAYPGPTGERNVQAQKKISSLATVQCIALLTTRRTWSTSVTLYHVIRSHRHKELLITPTDLDHKDNMASPTL